MKPCKERIYKLKNMKILSLIGGIVLTSMVGNVRAAEAAIDPVRAANTVILDAAALNNLGVKTEEVEEQMFEETLFSLGKIVDITSKRAVVSSRVAGRMTEIFVQEGDMVEAGQVIAKIESRQPGNPPPIIEVKAPISGLVLTSHLRIGEPVELDKEFLDIVDLSQVWAVARVPENHASKLKEGTLAHISIPALGGKAINGEMVRLGTSVDTASGTIEAVFRVANVNKLLRPGMRAEFQIVTAKRENVMSVAKESIQGNATNRHVFVKDFEIPNAFVKTPVKTGQVCGGRVEILSGLFPGDLVVTNGSYSLGFAGGSSVSIREALDAAHGHEHNADGSEKAKGGAANAAEAKEGHNHGAEEHAEEAKGLTSRERWLIGGLVLQFLILIGVWTSKKNTK